MLRTALARLRAFGPKGLVQRFEYWAHAYGVDDSEGKYPERIRRLSTLSGDEIAQLRRVSQGIHGPMLSLVMPVGNPPIEYLISAIASTVQQIYDTWELWLVPTGSADPRVRAVLEDHAERDERVRVMFDDLTQGMAAACNRALEHIRGEFVAFLGASDQLRADALLIVAAETMANPAICMLYSDECHIDSDGQPLKAHFKPGWNTELLLGQNYVGNLLVARADLVRRIGGFRPGFEGGHDHDLALRLSAVCGHEGIQHLPYLLYRKRVPSGSVDGTQYAAQAGLLAVQNHLATFGRPAAVRAGPAPFTYRVEFQIPDPPPLVSVIIPTRNAFDILHRCVEGLIQKTVYKDYEVLIVDNQTDEARAQEYLRRCARRPGCRVLTYDKPFNYSAINNFAAARARGEFLCLLNNDTEVIAPGWLTELVMWGTQPGIGAVGAKLLYPDGTIQHAGITLGIMGLAGHAHKGLRKESFGYFNRLAVAHEVGAVTGACLLLRKAHYEAVGGLDEQHLAIAFNDVDLCLKLRAQGLRNVWTPHAVLYHHESKSRGWEDTREKRARFEQEAAYMLAKWGDQLRDDPGYNTNLSENREDFGLAWPTRLPSSASHLQALLRMRAIRLES